VAGEAACTGAQGANRLASNSLLECLVFGRSAALAALTDTSQARAHWNAQTLAADDDWANPNQRNRGYPRRGHINLGASLERYLGVERSGLDLEKLAATLPLPDDEIYAQGEREVSKVGSASLVAAMAARSALIRSESRGAHYRSDYPHTSARWQGRILWQRSRGMSFEEVGI
jgi:L-aspartate oxidase